MKYKKNSTRTNTKKKKFIMFLVIGLVILSIVGFFAYCKITHRSEAIVAQTGDGNTYAPPTEAEIKKEAEANAAKKDELIKAPDQSAQTTPSQTIELKAQKESNGTVTIFTKLNGYSSGTCTINVSNGSKSTSQSADIIFQREYSSCAGFSVPIDSIGSGNWQIKLATKTASGSKESTINLEVK